MTNGEARGPTGARRAVGDPTAWEKLGGLFFRARSATPVALVVVVALWPTPGGLSPWRAALAAVLIAAGEFYRFRAVGVAGKCTRTRGSNVRELVTSGPFARVRNPLYVGNFILTYGLVVLSKIAWLTWVFPIAFFLQYSAIVAWEERILSRTFGTEYEEYRREVPAWIPSARRYGRPSAHAFGRDTAVRSERDSLRAVAIIAAALVLKHLFFHEAVAGLVSAAARAMGIGQ